MNASSQSVTARAKVTVFVLYPTAKGRLSSSSRMSQLLSWPSVLSYWCVHISLLWYILVICGAEGSRAERLCDSGALAPRALPG